jgi:hypothetical protein
MAVKYLYIDDEFNKTVKGITKNLTSQPDKLLVTHTNALGWDEQIKYIKEVIPSYDGILLDLKLDFVEGQPLYHYGPALAQQLKTLIKNGDIKKDFPILLCSTHDNLRKYHDSTGRDLFAECFDKMSLDSDVIIKFVEHVKAYQQISNKPNDINSLLAIGEGDYDILEECTQFFNKMDSVHQKADFLLRGVIQPTGVLIDEDVLAIRLGIDRETSENDWNSLKLLLSDYEYKGIYVDYFNHSRWWMRGLFQWWQIHFPNAKQLPLLTAEAKTKVINDKLGFNFKALTLPKHHASSKYWYKCSHERLDVENLTKITIPVADGDGLAFLPPNHPWQDREFISYCYILEEGSQEISDAIRKELSPYEIENFNELLEKHNGE